MTLSMKHYPKNRTVRTYKKRRTGTITFYNDRSGFGLIKLDNFGPRIVLRQPEAQQQFTVGDRIEFDVARDERYIQIAVNVEQI